MVELRRFAEVGVGAMLEEAFEVGEHGGLVGLDGEHEVGGAKTHALGKGSDRGLTYTTAGVALG